MNIAIIVAAGSAERFGTAIPKQYQKLGSKKVISYAIEAFAL
jgi:4-diphosphocytidyl-2-methyl-D-erithritol synthase